MQCVWCVRRGGLGLLGGLSQMGGSGRVGRVVIGSCQRGEAGWSGLGCGVGEGSGWVGWCERVRESG